jgi:putative membrane protein
MDKTNTFWNRIAIIVGGVISAVVAFLILGPRPEGMAGSLDVSGLPLVNAGLNGLTTVLLVVALVLVKSGRIGAHKNVMLSAFGSSTLFLLTYVVYHWFKAGPKAYVGDYRELYLVILFTHIVLAAVVIPLALVTLYRGWTDQRASHKKLARITWPIWMYVGVTGVVIYWMLYL